MSDMGDFFRQQRQNRQKLRRHWHECPHCAKRFGNGTLVPPGGTCRHDGWKAPGNKGDDWKAVRQDEFNDKQEREERIRRKTAREKSYQFGCPYCERRFQSKKARGQHVNKVHGKQHEKERRTLHKDR